MPPEKRADDEYNAACSYALAGDKADALRTLRASIDDGYLDADRIARDSDFASLRTDPDFAGALGYARSLVAADKQRWTMQALQTPVGAELSTDDKLVGLAQLWAEVRYDFANWWHVPELDWDRAYREAIPRVEATHSTFAYVRELQRLIAQLHDGHSNVYFPMSSIRRGDVCR